MSYDWHTVRAKQQLFGNNFNIPKYDSKIHIIHYFVLFIFIKMIELEQLQENV